MLYFLQAVLDRMYFQFVDIYLECSVNEYSSSIQGHMCVLSCMAYKPFTC